MAVLCEEFDGIQELFDPIKFNRFEVKNQHVMPAYDTRL